MKYKSTVTALGEMVPSFLAENFVIIFNDNAPSAMAEISVLHTIEEMNDTIKVNDQFIIGDNKYTVTAVGDEANITFSQLGHCTLKFDGKDTVELPGQIELKGGKAPDIKVGDTIMIM